MTRTIKPAIRVHIRWMIRRDMPEVLEIDQHSFGRYAWCLDDFVKSRLERTT